MARNILIEAWEEVTTRHMMENIGADDVRFTADELTQFNSELEGLHIEGARLPQGLLPISGIEAPPKK
jgi:hypothetical protein